MAHKILIAFSTLALAMASAATSYSVKLFDASVLNGNQLKPGEYRLELKENTAVLKLGKRVVEAPVKVENTPTKISTTSVKYVNGQIQEIRLGGTSTKLVFAEVTGTN